MLLLHISTDMPNKKKNGFVREFLPDTAQVKVQQSFAVDFRELIGVHQGDYYLMGINPSLVYRLSKDLQQLDSIKLHLQYVPNFIPRFYGLLDYPLVHLLGGNAHSMITAHLEKDSTQVIPLNLPGFFANPVLLDSGRFMLKVIDSLSLDSYFVTMDGEGQILQEERHLSKREGDAGFRSSGQLRQDLSSGLLTYMHFNDHHWMSFGPGFHVHHRGHTLDTNVHIKIQIIRHERNVNYKKPPMTVNAFSSVQDGILLIQSKLRADNESRRDFNKQAVIDGFDILNGSYLGSFYLPQNPKNEIKQFYYLQDGTVLTLSGSTVTIYQVPIILNKHTNRMARWEQLPQRIPEPLQQIQEQKGGIKT